MKKPDSPPEENKEASGGIFSRTAGFLTSTLWGLGRGVFEQSTSLFARPSPPKPGAAPGIEHYLKATQEDIPVRVTMIDYGADFLQTHQFSSARESIDEPRPEGLLCRWINVDGLNPGAVDLICKHFGVHTLSAEDVLNTFQRPKIESFSDHLQVTVRQIQLLGERLKNEQITFFLFADTVLSFQEEPGDVFDPVRRRMENPTSRFRSHKADYLFYTLIDSIVDHLFPLLEGYGTALEDLEEEISLRPSPACQQKLFALRRDLSLLRRVLWPLREVVDNLQRDESGLISKDLGPFFRDVLDHAMQVIDLLETYRETASGLGDLYQSHVGNRMNEIMKVLTIMASFFIPITFVAGVYGMNFEHIPELGWEGSYFVFWGVCLTMSGSLAFFFWRKGWIGKG